MPPKEGGDMSEATDTRPAVPTLRTTGVIARELGVPLHRVQYVLCSRLHIQPSARAGPFRLYDSAAIAMLRHELNAIDARRPASDG